MLSRLSQAIFAEPWWLEAVSPSRWSTASVEVDGSECAIWPYVVEKLSGSLIRIGSAPLCPYLGPGTEVDKKGKRPKQISGSYELVEELLKQLPPYDICKLNLRADQGPWFPLHTAGFTATARQTYVIDELSDTSSIWENCSSSTRGVIRKAEKKLSIRTELYSKTLWQMINGTFGRQGRAVPYSYELLERCVSAAVARGRGRVTVAHDGTGKPHAAIFVVWDEDRTYYLVGGSDQSLRDSGGLSLLVWNSIKHAGSTSRAFDFEGSMVPSIEKFFCRFGGRPETYLQVMNFSARGRLAWNAYNMGAAAKKRFRDRKTAR